MLGYGDLFASKGMADGDLLASEGMGDLLASEGMGDLLASVREWGLTLPNVTREC